MVRKTQIIFVFKFWCSFQYLKFVQVRSEAIVVLLYMLYTWL